MAMQDYSILTAQNTRKRNRSGGAQVSYSHQVISINGQILKIENPSEDTYYVIGAENHVDFHDFECSGDEVLVESSPPASPTQMATRLATPAQGSGNCSPNTTVRELIVIPELPSTIHLQHAIQQVSNAVVEVNGENSGHSSPNTDGQHTYITVASEGAYHVQYVEPQELYTDGHPPQMETLRTYPLYNVTAINAQAPTEPEAPQEPLWNEGNEEYAGFVGEGEENNEVEAAGVQQATRMSPATVQWLRNNYEPADGVSMPRSGLYSHYLRYCSAHRLDPVNAASFGKLIRSVFVGLRTRRLGTRGNSKYHYYGIRAKPNAPDTPPLNDAGNEKSGDSPPVQEEANEEPEEPEGPTMLPAHRQFLGPMLTPEPPALDVSHDVVERSLASALMSHHRRYGIDFLKAVASLDISGVERARRTFCRRPPRELPRQEMYRLMQIQEVSDWLSKADFQLHQMAVELLMPEVLRPQPPALTQAIRNFAKGLESALTSTGGSNADAAAALAAALRRYTSLNHLAQAARAVLTNKHQINQMLADLNRVDFRVIREQAVWACCSLSPATVAKLEDDFKTILGRGATLEQWGVWLEGCVEESLAPHVGQADYGVRARRLLLDWSFYCSLVIRELTLRSAASFGSFHLIRLLYDEYVAYLVEGRVGRHGRLAPIAVMYLAQKESEKHLNGIANGDGPNATVHEHEQFADDDEEPDWEWGEDDEGSPDPKRRNEE